MLNVDIRQLTRRLLIILGVIVALNLVEGFYKFLQGDENSVIGIALSMFDVDSETSVPTWFAVILLAGAAAILAIISRLKHLADDGDRHYWTGLAFIFLYLSMDESAAIHERTSIFFAQLSATIPIFLFGWVILFGALLIIFAAVYIPFVLRLPPATRNRFVIAGVVFVSGALLSEMIQGQILTSFGVGIQSGLMVILEESLELLGAILFVRALLLYLEALRDGVMLTFQGDAGVTVPASTGPTAGSRSQRAPALGA